MVKCFSKEDEMDNAVFQRANAEDLILRIGQKDVEIMKKDKELEWLRSRRKDAMADQEGFSMEAEKEIESLRKEVAAATLKIDLQKKKLKEVAEELKLARAENKRLEARSAEVEEGELSVKRQWQVMTREKQLFDLDRVKLIEKCNTAIQERGKIYDEHRLFVENYYIYTDKLKAEIEALKKKAESKDPENKSESKKQGASKKKAEQEGV
jgi:hypothetical protein